MKTGAIVGLAIFLASAFFAITQQAADPPARTPAQPATNAAPKLSASDAAAARMGIRFVDLNTFKVVGPGTDIPQNEGINSPEARRRRQLSVMHVLDPVAYHKLFPITPEQQAAIDRSLFQIDHYSEYVAERRARMTPQQREEEAAYAAAIGALLVPSATPVGPPPQPMPGPLGNKGASPDAGKKN